MGGIFENERPQNRDSTILIVVLAQLAPGMLFKTCEKSNWSWNDVDDPVMLTNRTLLVLQCQNHVAG